MQQSAASRKRPAPGTSPMPQQQPAPPMPPYPYQQMPENPDFTNFDFSQTVYPDQTFSDPAFAAGNNDFSYLQNTSQTPVYGSTPALPTAPSTDLVRRTRNQQLATQQVPQQQEQWNGGTGTMPAQGDEETEQDLDMKVQLAKRDAQGKRKQIPPFVQKLSSFLDSNNTELIRWSDDGRSFIVLDEDEFARTLIPELFKHNNYASFVRQLNMYGFHKTVNITDGSLRQSEKARKGVKPPSMYSHLYFRKNRPDLLWLIQKPMTKAGAKRKREGGLKDGYDSDDERQFSPVPVGAPPGELGAPNNTNQDVAAVPRTELVAVRHELQRLQTQQRFISKMITQLKEQNDAFYRQASAFQALHDRHENSINAILTFLATFYNRSLENHGGAQNLMNLFSNAAQSPQQQDRVVEEFNDGAAEHNNQVQRYVKRPPLLIGAGPLAHLQQNLQQPGSAVTAPNSARASVSPPDDFSQRASTSSAPPDTTKPRSTASPVVKDEASTPNVLQQAPESHQMMSLINSVNATNASSPNTTAPTFDFSSALHHYQNSEGNAPLTPQQRDDMLALMVGQHGHDQSNSNNALASPHPPAMPDLNQLKRTQQQLEMLTNMQKQQDEKVQELNRRLQPLSPTGAIPGLGQPGDENPFDLTGAPGDYDPNAFIDFDNSSWNDQAGAESGDLSFDFGNGPVGDVGNGDMNWEFGNTGGDAGADMFQTSPVVTNDRLAPQAGGEGDGGGRVESVSSVATSPAGTVADTGGEDGVGTPTYKKQRRS
ncbi:hypothetical protein LTR36_009325 [Oleoguttula mirabilis]|uniref:HSF-type DNA-binding domain-containing protein n=1 Tax=Oleoguttula mirabilis TaxID=1507867 RepID=A0AAV9JTM7_9PEZI|nr:hypothetical protein LTR36_009325 [Oleoguttula mirabilis]